MSVNYFTYVNTESWVRSGLRKSAFTSKIYFNLPLDYYVPGIQLTYSLFKLSTEGKYVKPKFYQLHDSYLMFYRSSPAVLQALKKNMQSMWWKVINAFAHTSKYLKLNEVTANSQELSALAGAKFLANLLKQVKTSKLDVVKDAKVNVEEIASSVFRDVTEFKESQEDVAIAVMTLGGTSYTHEAISIFTYLKKPEEFRKRVKLLKFTALYLRKYLTSAPTSLTHQQQVSMFGGVSGVTKLLRESQLSDILPQELAVLKTQLPNVAKKLFFTLKLAHKQLLALERSAVTKPVIFIDKSGSMAEDFENVPKISIACGLALALYKKFNADIYLFDVDVDKVKPKDVIKTLLTIRADSGTDIAEVLREVVRIGKKDVIYIIITDGIDEVSNDVVNEVKKAGLVSKVRFILIPPAWELSWVKNFKYFRVTDIASFDKAVFNALSKN